MKRYMPWIAVLCSITCMLFLSVSCCKFPTQSNGSGTTTPTSTVVATGTVGNATATPTAGCAFYSDSFSTSASLSNYGYFMNSTQVSTTASGADYAVTGGELVVAPTAAGNNGGLAIVNDNLFPHALSNYTVEADFQMNSYQSNEGLFGIAFRTGSNGSFYSFQWSGNIGNANGGTPDWEVESNTGTPSVNFSFPAKGVTSYGYVLGTWVHLKVVASGNTFQCYVNHNDGTGDHLIYTLTDSTYTSGGVGVRTYGINTPNVARIDNLYANAQSCAGIYTATFTPTNTPTATMTATSTYTATATATSSCVVFTDNYTNPATLADYDYFLNSTQAASTAAGCDYAIVGGFLQVEPTSNPGTNNGGLAIVDNAYFSHSLTHYTITASFEMDNYTDSEGVFGVAFRTGNNGSFDCFQWNGNFANGDGGTPDWEIEENTGSPSVGFSYPASGSTSYGYVSGTTVTLQVVATGSNYLCYVNHNDGTGNHLIYNVTDSTYANGGVGVRTYGIHEGNKVDISNFSVDTCP